MRNINLLQGEADQQLSQGTFDVTTLVTRILDAKYAKAGLQSIV
jgi:hypothetical protein